jgi:DNA replication protein DnaC
MMKIETQLNDLRLPGMIRRWNSLKETKQLNGLTLQDGLELLLQAEQEYRVNRKRDRLTKQANFRYHAIINELAYTPERNLDKGTIALLSDCSYVSNGEFILITGATGCGKSFIASALGQQACSMGYTTLYTSMKKLMTRLKLSRADGTYVKLINKISKHQLLILDDFGLYPLEQQQSLDLMEIIEDRHGKNATIIVSQLPVSEWYDVLQESTIADAILDRVVHTSHRIELKGESLRKIK